MKEYCKISIRVSDKVLALPGRTLNVLLAFMSFSEFITGGASLTSEVVARIADAVGVTPRKVRDSISELCEAGLLIRKKPGKYVYDRIAMSRKPVLNAKEMEV